MWLKKCYWTEIVKNTAKCYKMRKMINKFNNINLHKMKFSNQLHYYTFNLCIKKKMWVNIFYNKLIKWISLKIVGRS